MCTPSFVSRQLFDQLFALIYIIWNNVICLLLVCIAKALCLEACAPSIKYIAVLACAVAEAIIVHTTTSVKQVISQINIE